MMTTSGSSLSASANGTATRTTTTPGISSSSTTINGIYSGGGSTSFGNAYGYYSYDDIISTTRLDAFGLLMVGLQESKIIEIMDILVSNLSTDEFTKVIKCTVGSRHFSEDFLLKYIDYIDESTLFMRHRENIKSGEYNSIALYLETKEKK